MYHFIVNTGQKLIVAKRVIKMNHLFYKQLNSLKLPWILIEGHQNKYDISTTTTYTKFSFNLSHISTWFEICSSGSFNLIKQPLFSPLNSLLKQNMLTYTSQKKQPLYLSSRPNYIWETCSLRCLPAQAQQVYTTQAFRIAIIIIHMMCQRVVLSCKLYIPTIIRN